MFSVITYKHSKFSLHKVHKAWLSQYRGWGAGGAGVSLFEGLFPPFFQIFLKLNLPEFIIKRDKMTKKREKETKKIIRLDR